MTGSILDELTKTTGVSFQEIFSNLLDGEHDLDLKSHIFKPKQLAALSTFAEHLNNQKYPNSAKLIEKFIDKYLRNMVSFKRMSRIEIVKALSGFIKDTENKDIQQKLV